MKRNWTLEALKWARVVTDVGGEGAAKTIWGKVPCNRRHRRWESRFSLFAMHPIVSFSFARPVFQLLNCIQSFRHSCLHCIFPLEIVSRNDFVKMHLRSHLVQIFRVFLPWWLANIQWPFYLYLYLEFGIKWPTIKVLMGTPNHDGGDMLRYQSGLKYERISQIIAWVSWLLVFISLSLSSW